MEPIGHGAMSGEFQRQSLYTTLIHILDDDSLLNIFRLCQPFLLGEDQGVNGRFEGGGRWVGERWWYRPAHVCQRWRNLILGSASYLGLCIVCANGTPVADMLAHSPPLPLVIDYQGTDITTEDEEAIILALEQLDRVRRIRFNLPILKLQKLTMAIDGEYSVLEYLILWVPRKDKNRVLTLPETLQMPRLRHLTINCSIPIRFQILTTTVGLVALHLALYHKSTYFQPAVLLQSISLMPQLEMLLVNFHLAITDRDVERQLMRTPITTHATLPSLRVFTFQTASSYSEAVLSRIIAPRLEDFQICYPRRLTFSVPQLLQFMRRTEKFRFERVGVHFESERVYVYVNPRETNMQEDAFSVNVDCRHLDQQASSVAHIFDGPSQLLSAVEHLNFVHKVHSRSSEEHNRVDRAEWHKLLRSFSNVKTLRVRRGLVDELSRCLRLEDGEPSLQVLPELQELTYSGSSNTIGAFTSFIDARQKAGHPVTLINHK